MPTKSFRKVTIKNADKGEVEAVFSTFNVVDHDGDVTLPGAFPDGKSVPISAYGHSSWGSSPPVGVGRIRTTDTEAILDGKFFLDTQAGHDTFTAVKQLAAEGLGEWSYGYDIVEAEPGTWDGEKAQLLRKLDPHEVSPVLLGAGINTRTLAAKDRKNGDTDNKAAIGAHSTDTTDRSWDGPATVASLPSEAAALRAVHAWRDSSGDPDAKSSYKFPHHHGQGGAANVTACRAIIAALNGARGGANKIGRAHV